MLRMIHRFAGAKLFVDRPQPKLVLYWHMGIVEEGAVEVDDEVDEVAWLSRREALSLLDHRSDRLLLRHATANYRAGLEATIRPAPMPADVRPLLLVEGGSDDPRCAAALEIISRAAGIAA